jgi:hypothetical protein
MIMKDGVAHDVNIFNAFLFRSRGNMARTTLSAILASEGTFAFCANRKRITYDSNIATRSSITARCIAMPTERRLHFIRTMWRKSLPPLDEVGNGLEIRGAKNTD